MTHKLPDLPYDFSALEPHIDTRTMAVHHDKHHQAYVDNLNRALEGLPKGYEELQNASTIQLLKDLDAVPGEIRTAVRNNGGGHFCHSLFWRCMSPRGGGAPSRGPCRGHRRRLWFLCLNSGLQFTRLPPAFWQRLGVARRG